MEKVVSTNFLIRDIWADKKFILKDDGMKITDLANDVLFIENQEK